MTQPADYDFDDTPEEQVQEPVETNETEDQPDIEDDVEEDSESSTDSEETHDKPIFTEKQQRIFDEAIGKKTFKLREMEREAEQLRKRLEEVERPVTQSRPQVPALPDPFAVSDEEYKRQIMHREQALISAAAYDMRMQMLQNQQAQIAQEAAQKQQEVLVEKVQSYAQRAKTLGVKAEELQAAGSIVGQFGIEDSLVQYILEDDHGPLITKYLSQNIGLLDSLRQMHPTKAAVMIATEIKSKAAALKPKFTNAPDPIRRPQPSGVQVKPKGPKGATFE
jgi:hypothetical protein